MLFYQVEEVSAQELVEMVSFKEINFNNVMMITSFQEMVVMLNAKFRMDLNVMDKTVILLYVFKFYCVETMLLMMENNVMMVEINQMMGAIQNVNYSRVDNLNVMWLTDNQHVF